MTTIRRATAADAAALAALRWEWRCERRVPAEPYDAFVAAFADWQRAHVATHTAYVAEAGGEVVGMAWLAAVARAPNPDEHDRCHGDVQSVYVRPAHRDGGTGTRLVEALVADARARGMDHLTVHSGTRSLPVYARLGFAPFDRLLTKDL